MLIFVLYDRWDELKLQEAAAFCGKRAATRAGQRERASQGGGGLSSRVPLAAVARCPAQKELMIESLIY